MKAEEILREYKNNDEALSAEVTRDGVMFSEQDVLVMLQRLEAYHQSQLNQTVSDEEIGNFIEEFEQKWGREICSSPIPVWGYKAVLRMMKELRDKLNQVNKESCDCKELGNMENGHCVTCGGKRLY